MRALVCPCLSKNEISTCKTLCVSYSVDKVRPIKFNFTRFGKHLFDRKKKQTNKQTNKQKTTTTILLNCNNDDLA